MEDASDCRPTNTVAAAGVASDDHRNNQGNTTSITTITSASNSTALTMTTTTTTTTTRGVGKLNEALTQDYVVWGESEPVDLRRIASPQIRRTGGTTTSLTFDRTPATTTTSSTTFSSATPCHSASSSRTLLGESSAPDHHHRSLLQPLQTHEKPVAATTTNSALKDVTRCLVDSPKKQPPMRVTIGSATKPKTTSSNNYAPENEVNGIFCRLENEQEPEESLLESDGNAHGIDDVFDLPTPPRTSHVRFGSNRPVASRHSRRQRAALSSSLSTTAAETSSSLTVANRRKRQRCELSFLNKEQQQDNSVASKAQPGGPTNCDSSLQRPENMVNAAYISASKLNDDFEDLLKEVTTPSPTEKHAGGNHCPATLGTTKKTDPLAAAGLHNQVHEPVGSGSDVSPRVSNVVAVTRAMSSDGPTVRSMPRKATLTPLSSTLATSSPSSSLSTTKVPFAPHTVTSTSITSQSENRQAKPSAFPVKQSPAVSSLARPTVTTSTKEATMGTPVPNVFETKPVMQQRSNATAPDNMDLNDSQAVPDAEWDEFGELDFSMEDLAEIDNLVSKATTEPEYPGAEQQSIQNTKNEHIASAMLASDSLPPPSLNHTPAGTAVRNDVTSNRQAEAAGDNEDDVDPFGEFPEIDFDELDKSIALHSTQIATTQLPSVSSLVRDVQKLGQLEWTPPDPHAPVRNPRVTDDHTLTSNSSSSPSFLCSSRYKVIQIKECFETKTLLVATWNADMLQDNVSRHFADEEDSLSSHAHQSAESSNWDGVVHLRGEWSFTELAVGDIVHICSLQGKFRTDVEALPLTLHTQPPSGSDEEDDLVLVVHPDLLLTPTVVSDAVSCVRRAVLKSRLGSMGLTCKLLLDC